ncbi:MAG: ADP-ribosylglycohydrolase family protein [Candidatus Hydrogenedentes bacterium]|nr:ADP-ribosylglycohydrolase family protein [Candidatus Hydrogenedentota bacterium]
MSRCFQRSIPGACAALALVCAAGCVTTQTEEGAQAVAGEELRIDLAVFEDKIRGGWAGQMAGVCYGDPTEFRWRGRIVDADLKWSPEMVNGALDQDDLYVEMTFAEVLDRVGLDATMADHAAAFRDSKYKLWHANAAARRHLNNHIDAPLSGHPLYNMHSNDIDFQIEADFIGMMAPGMPQQAIELCDRIGRVVNYGDGVYGGMFVAGMYAAAYFETDIQKIVEAGIACMPEGSGYRQILEDTVALYEAHPDSWTECWRLINEKWDKDDACPEGALAPFNIDARLNGAYIAIGMLYGAGDLTRTIDISTRCGQDSDCNPSSAAGVLGVLYGYKALDPAWVGGIPAIADTKFNFTNYTFNEISQSTLKRAIAAAETAGGRVEGNTLIVPRQLPAPPALEQWSMGLPEKQFLHDDPAWTWRGAWETRPYANYYDPAAKVSTAAGNEAEFAFTGSGVAIVGMIEPEQGGMVDIFLDGNKVSRVNCYIGKDTYDRDIWHAYGLENTKHTVRLLTVPDADPRSRGSHVRVEYAKTFRPEE